MGLKGQKFSETLRHGHLWLGKRRESGIWYVKYRHPQDGTYKLRSLRTTLKKEAIRQADHLSAQITNRQIGVSDGTVPITEVFRLFLEAKTGRLKDEAVKRVTSSMHMFERWLAATRPNVRLMRHITPTLIREFQSYRLREHAVTERTVDNDITNLHTVSLWAKRECLIDRSPFDYSRNGPIDLFNKPVDAQDTYTADEYAALVTEAEARGDSLIRDLVIVLANTGMRFGEATHLVPESLHWRAEIPYIEVKARNGWSPKDPHEVKKIPMKPGVQEVLRRRSRACGGTYLFTNGAGNLVAENHSRERLKRLFPVVGIGPERRLHWHSWRNYFILRCLEAGIPVHVIMKWTGHDSANMCIHYAQAKTEQSVVLAEFRKLM